jgi:hypothetical protein
MLLRLFSVKNFLIKFGKFQVAWGAIPEWRDFGICLAFLIESGQQV